MHAHISLKQSIVIHSIKFLCNVVCCITYIVYGIRCVRFLVFLNGENTLVLICAIQLRHVAAKTFSSNDSWLLDKELLHTHIITHFPV